MPQAWLHRTGAVLTSAPEHYQNIKGESRRDGWRKGLETTSELTSDLSQVAKNACHMSLMWKYTFTLTGGGHTWLLVKNIMYSCGIHRRWWICAAATMSFCTSSDLQCTSTQVRCRCFFMWQRLPLRLFGLPLKQTGAPYEHTLVQQNFCSIILMLFNSLHRCTLYSTCLLLSVHCEVFLPWW